jgi:DNA-binding transcriptional LysR family regulator
MRDISFDQLRVFIAVVEAGSFSAAARHLRRAQSAVTYSIQKLEEQSGLELFDRSAYRPALSEQGRGLLVQARRILEDVGAFQALAEGMASGLEAELTVVVEAMFPMSLLVSALREFQKAFPSVQTRIQVESLGAAREAVIDGFADLGLVIHTGDDNAILRFAPVTEIELVAVAAPDHPLAAMAGPLSVDQLREHLQLVFSDRTAPGRPTDRATPDRGVMAERTWRLADLGAKHSMLLAGLGWGSMPRHIVENDLEEGRLVELRPAAWDGFAHLPRLPVVIATRRDNVLGVAGQWLLARLTATGARAPQA